MPKVRKAKSKKQQQLFGIVHAVQKGDIKSSEVSPQARQMAKTIGKGKVKQVASTKHTDLPEKKKKPSKGVFRMVKKESIDKFNILSQILEESNQ